MRFPSVAALTLRARDILFRFPWVLAMSVVAATAAMISVDSKESDRWIRLSMAAALGLPLATSLSLLAERVRWPAWKSSIVQVLGILLLFWFYHEWPGPDHRQDAIRYFQLSIGLHLAVAFSAYLPGVGRGGFWQYNRLLFEAFLRAVLFTVVLYVGLVIALAALDKLFGVHVPSETYARLWILLGFVANTWIFLGGVPADLDTLDDLSDYPRGLKVFTQFILTPLVAVYLVILTAYLVKVVATGSWPNGWIGYLVSSVAVTGILGFLLVHPLRLNDREGWIRTYSRWLFIGLIPAAVMFLLALGKRVAPYGLTELRFLGLLLGAWLLGIAILFTVRRDLGIRIIPTTLAAVLLVTLYGPMSATSFSLRSQGDRLHGLLTANHLLEKSGTGESTVSDGDRQEISAALRFLLERHDADRLASIFGGHIPGGVVLVDSSRVAVDSTARKILAALGAEYVPQYGGSNYFSLNARADSNATMITGFDYSKVLEKRDTTIFFAGPDTLTAVYDSATTTVRILRNGSTRLVFPLERVVDSLVRRDSYQEFSATQMRVSAQGDGARGLLAMASVSGVFVAGRPRINSWQGTVYLTMTRD